jgi:hypothetical protein
MGISKQKDLDGKIERCLVTEDFVGLSEKLAKWRLDPIIRLMDTNRTKGRILGFIKGLRLSAQIAYLIRTIVSQENVEVNWGHLIDNEGNSCSPECDIIIHRQGHIQKWNGSKNPIMDFRFIKCKNALAVISCKSWTNSVDKKYCKDFLKYNLKNIFLFVECCNPNSIDRLKEQAIAAGYKGFFYLHTIDKRGVIKRDESVYLEFIQTIKDVSKLDRRKRLRKKQIIHF